MQRLIAEHTGQPVATVERDADRDRWFTAEEAVDYGFVDEVVHRRVRSDPGTAPRPSVASGLGAGRVRGWGQGDGPVHDPTRHRADGPRRAGRRHLQPAAHRPDHLPRHRDRRRRGQRRHRAAAPPGVREPGASPSTSTSTRRAARSRRPWPSTTRCSTSRHGGNACVGQAASAAAVLLAAGRRGKRTVLRDARWCCTSRREAVRGPWPDLALQAREIVRLREEVEGILHRHTGQPSQAPHRHRARPHPHRAGGGRLRAGGPRPGQPEGGGAS